MFCLDVDDDDDIVDEAAAPAIEYDYHGIFANPRDDEAPPVWGYRAPSCWSRLMSSEHRFEYLVCIAACIGFALLTLWAAVSWNVQVRNRPSFSAALAAGFDVTLRMNRTCVDQADVVVSYAGVALGWARAEPQDCAEKRRDKDVEVLARGGGVGLPVHLRERMASEWRSGNMELDIDVTIFGNTGGDVVTIFGNTVGPYAAGDFPLMVMTCKVRLDGKNRSQCLLHGNELYPHSHDHG